jgi:hypothetical protein
MRWNEYKNITIVNNIMVRLVRTHTYFLTYKEYKSKYLKTPFVNKKLLQDEIPTRTHIKFQ